jgi:dienelactone hydrolase
MERFVDTTDRPGPAEWVLGDIPAGKEDYPVQGVSWFEAMAYARFRGKSLPTVYHWARAALPPLEAGFLVLTPQMIAYSNLEGEGPIPVASTPDMSSAGAYNMAGNVREWCLNQRGDLRFAMGGKWDEPEYVLFNAIPVDPWDRAEGNGFRCMRIPDGQTIQDEFLQPIGEYRFEANRERFTKQGIEAALGFFRAPPTPDFDPIVDKIDEENRHYVKEELTVAAPGTPGNRLPIIIQKPKSGDGPWPAVIFQSGTDALYLSDPDQGLVEWSQFVPQSGRILVRPILSGMYYRNDGTSNQQFADPAGQGALIRNWAMELNQTVAYLKTRPDVDADAITYYGISLGAILGVIFGAANDDVQALVLALGGLPPIQLANVDGPTPLIEEFATLVHQPTLMINGRYDFLFPVEQSQKPLFNRLAVAPEHKQLKLYDAGHSMPSQADTIRDITTFLDRYDYGIAATVAGSQPNE